MQSRGLHLQYVAMGRGIMGRKTFDEKCQFRYDEFREGATKKGHGEHTIFERCILRKTGNKKCLFQSDTHITCPISIHRKHKAKGVRFKGKDRKS